MSTTLLNGQTPMTPSATAVTYGSDWTTTKITADNALNYPWEITYGPDDTLWVTERVGEKIVRVDITTATNTPTTLIDLSAKVENSKQGGLMGMAIHPELYNDINVTANNYVFVAYTYDDLGVLKLRISRLLYNHVTGVLTEDTSLSPNGAIIEGLPASEDHNSGRLIFGPDSKLYYTIGDQGANQFDYSCNPVLSQILPTSTTDYDNYPGKVLRLNIDGTIPSDNPVLNGVKSHVYTYGHRNAQGIIFGEDGTLYASEHGAKVDDEINVINAGKNYGWPEIAGYYDNMAYTYCNWSSLGGACNSGDFSDHNCPVGADTATEYESYPTLADVPLNFQPPIGTYNSTITSDPTGGWFTWPTIAPSGIDIHEKGNIPNWGRSLLVPTLKKGTIYRSKLTPNGNDIDNDFYEEFHSSNDRYRDIAISPDGLVIYAVTDNGGGTSGPSSTGGVSITNPGVIIKIEYVGTPVTDPPVASCQDFILTLNGDGEGTLLVSDINNGSTGGSAGIDTIVIDRSNFECSHVGIPQTVWLTVTDNNGNESRCSSMVTVQANTSPNSITTPVLESIVSNCGLTVDTPIVVSNGCVDLIGTTTDQITYNPGESGVIMWSFNDNGNIVTALQNVTINALNAPTNILSVPESSTANISWDNVEGVASYNVRYRKTGTPIWTTIVAANNSITLTGLDLLTDYDFQVNSDCGSSQSPFSSIMNFTTTDISYCTPTVEHFPDDFYISNVKIENSSSIVLLNHSSTQNDDVSGYSDHTNGVLVPDLMVAENFNIDITLLNTHPWNKTTGHSVWIDYNQDGDFEELDERVWGTTAGDDLFPHGAVAQGGFVIPLTALVGNTRMRIASRTYYTGNNSCHLDLNSDNAGEFEDYTVNIVSPTLSLESIEATQVDIYPNPIKDTFIVKFVNTYDFDNLSINILDVQGRIIRVKEVRQGEHSIEFTNLSELNNGVYFINVISNSKKIVTKKLIKM